MTNSLFVCLFQGWDGRIILCIFSLKPYKKSGPGGGPYTSSGPGDRSGGGGATLTPSSSTLVINSLAYQILPGQGVGKQQSDSHDLGSAGYSSPSSTTSSPQQSAAVLQGSASSPLAVRKRPVADDTDGHLAYLPGDVLGDRYEIISTLGKAFDEAKLKSHQALMNLHVPSKL